MLNHNFSANFQSHMEALEDRVLFDGVPDAAIIMPADQAPADMPPAETQLLSQPEVNLARELVIVDGGVENREALLASIIEDYPDSALEIRFLDSDRNGIDQISEILSESDQKYDAIHLLSHGDDGQIQLGNTTLDDSNLSQYADQISGWAESLTDDADLLIYGCNLAETSQGQTFAQSLAAVTGADVAASDDLTGHESLGGDWDLEFSTGQIDTDIVITSRAQIEFVGVLNTVSGTVFADVNNDGTNNGEAGIDGVTVTASDATGAIVASAVTSGGGDYVLNNPSNGALQIEFSNFPAGYGVSTADGSADADTVSSVAFFDAGAGNETANLGLRVVDNASYPELEIGNRVWLDADRDGIQDAGEQGLLFVSVSLYDTSNPNNAVLVGSTTTDANGEYYFNDTNVTYPDGSLGLQPLTDYEVRLGPSNFGFLNPLDGLSVTLQDQGSNDRLDNDAIGLDTDGNGADDLAVIAFTSQSLGSTDHSLDFGVANIEVDRGDLPDVYDTSIARLGPAHILDGTTFLGSSVDADTFAFPSGDALGDDNNATDDEDGATFDTPLQAGHPANISVVASTDGYLNAWIDFQSAGVLGEVTVTHVNGTALASPTDINDLALNAGTTQLTIDVPANARGEMAARFRFTADPLGPSRSTTGTVGTGEVEDYVLAAIGNFTFNDLDADGIQDFADTALAGVVVNLLDGSGSPVLDAVGNPITTTSDSLGRYEFQGLPDGGYQIEFVAPSGLQLTAPNVTLDADDSDPNPTTGITGTFSISAGVTNNTVDAGFIPASTMPASLGDYVFFDADGDGVFSPGDTAVAGVVVNLLDGAGNPVLDSSGNPVTTTTDAAGSYQFTGLTAGGSYQVQFVAPTGQYFTTQDVGNDDTIDSDVDPATGLSQVVTLGAGENNLTLDAGLIDEPVVPPPTASLGDYVFFDADGDGVVSSGDPAASGVVVNLLDGAGNPVLDGAGNPVTTTTDATGSYQFTGLTPGSSYQVEFIAPTGFDFTIQDAGNDDTIDSDVDPATGLSQVVTLSAGENNLTVDAGLINEPVIPPPTASLGDTVFFDADGDGVYDAGEAGVAGVVVNLLDGSGNPVLDSAGNPVTTTTDVNGSYQFTGLTPGGSYQVQFVEPVGFDFTVQDAGGDDTIDSDVDPATGLSQVVTLSAGENLSLIHI